MSSKEKTVKFLFVLVAYLGVSGAVTLLFDGNWQTFGTAFGVLLGIRLFFSAIEILGGVVSWRFYGKRRMTEKVLGVLQMHQFPPREYAHDDISAYLAGIESGLDVTPSVKKAAAELQGLLDHVRSRGGMLAKARTYSAVNRALDIYSPPSAAKNSGSTSK
jgi:hypothetical protein